MPSLDSCLTAIFEPGFIPADPGVPPTVPTVPQAQSSAALFVGAGSLRVNSLTNTLSVLFAGNGSLRADARTGFGLAATFAGGSSVSINASGSWTPAQLSSSELKAWYDFSDTATITHTSGSVDQVNDKSGNANHITGTTTARPITGTQTLNGLNVLVFDGTNDVLSKQSGTSLPSANPGAMLFVLRLISSGTSAGLAWISSNAGSFGDNCVMGRDNGDTGNWGNGISTGAPGATIFTESDNTNWHINSGVFTTASRTIYEDGTSKNTNSTAVTVATPDKVFVGQTLSRDRSLNRFLNGRIAQVLVINGTDTTTRQKIEGWALWKYGLQANLPGAHPYAGGAP